MFEYLGNFLTNLAMENKSDNTISGYKVRIERFLDFVDNMAVQDITRQDVTGFLFNLKESGLSPASIGAYVVALRSWGSWLEAELWDEQWRDVFRTFKIPKVAKHIPKVMGADDVTRMLKKMPKKTPIQKRNYALVLFIYTTGLRVSEVSDIDIVDVDLEERIVFVRDGKGGKDRYSFLSQDAIQAVHDWLEIRSAFNNAASPALWIGRGSNRLNRRMIENVVSKAALNCGFDASPHTLRRSRDTHLRNDGVSVEVISEMLGHADTGTTQAAYLNVDPLKMRDQAEAFIGG